jgi:inorganic triphosphatase YgiF
VADGADMIIQQQLVPALSGTVEVSKLILANYYYDSPQRDLRKHDIGFRSRTNNGSIEQTIKTSKLQDKLHSYKTSYIATHDNDEIAS